MQVKVIFRLIGASLQEGNCHQVTLKSVVIARNVFVVFVLSESLLIEFDLDLNILLAIAHKVVLNVLEIDYVIELFVSIKFSYQLILFVVFASRLLIPADSSLSIVYACYLSLESYITRY